MIRISGGEFRGRKIKSPRGGGSRPTLDRVREALFDIIGNDLSGIRFLDLYAGVGLVGIEALSRGAACVLFVERDGALVKILRENLISLGAENRGKIYHGPAAGLVLRLVKEPADIVFLDPPYGTDEAALVLSKLGYATLPPETLVIAQHHYKDRLPDKAGELRRTRQEKYGETVLSFYRRSVSGAE